jgi:hypothetical protein
MYGALDPDTLGGYIEAMAKDSKAETLKRFGRIEGQVRGLARMIEEDRYCIDIVTQIAAVGGGGGGGGAGLVVFFVLGLLV